MEQLQELKPEMEKCFRCSLCKMVPLPTVKHAQYTDACPAARHFEFHAYSTSGKQIMALSLLDGRSEANEEMARTAFACTACGYGDVACKFIMSAERHTVNMTLRSHLVEKGFGHPDHKETIENLKATGLPKIPVAQEVGSWADGLNIKVLPREKAKYLLYAGAGTTASEKTAATARQFAQLLQKADVDFGILGDAEQSSGIHAYWMGYRDLFSEIAEKNITLFEKTGVEKIITLDGSCFGAMHSKYPDAFRACNIDIIHATDFLLELVESQRLSLTTKVNKTVTYHDPCYLGRQSEAPRNWKGEEKTTLNCMTYETPPKRINHGINGVFDSPRQLLEKIPGLTFNEMHRIREYAFCCGGGGGVTEAYPELAKETALHRIDEAKNVGAETMVTSCHYCVSNFTHAQKNENDSLPTVDIVTLISLAAGIQE